MSGELWGMHPQRPAPPPAGRPPIHPPPFVGTVKLDAAGAGTIRGPVVPGDQVWTLEVINIAGNSTATPTLSLYNNDPNGGGIFLEGSTAGNGDVDDAGVLRLFPNDQLTFVWAAGTPGATMRCRVQYRIEAAG